MTEHVYPIVPASSGVYWAVIPAVLVMFFITAFLGYAVYASRNVVFALTGSGLQIRGDVYGRTVPREQLRADQARAVDLSADGQLRPCLRTNGIGLPGYSAGWFNLCSGEKALLFVTDRRRVVYVPTSDGYSLLMSVPDPDAFVRELRGKRL